jgi:hypothetical protein
MERYASTGVGTSTHLGMELLKAKMAIDIVHECRASRADDRAIGSEPDDVHT